jgi:hypothetical protein
MSSFVKSTQVAIVMTLLACASSRTGNFFDSDASQSSGTPTAPGPAPSTTASADSDATNPSNSGADDAGSAGDATVAVTRDAGRAPPGPMKGDPNKPMVSVPGVACGAPNIGFGTSVPTVKIDNRDVGLVYPCAHEGAPVTYFMFLHGTLQDGQKIPFTMNAWPIHTLVDQYNIVEVVPQAIGTQWGNGDNGQDLPFLYDVVDWVYSTFGNKFDIRSMWVQGGSWGAFYLSSTFACDPKFQNRLNGIQLIVGTGCPSCADRLSCIVGQQELQLGNGSALTDAQAEMYSDMFSIAPYATQHHCQAKTGPIDVGNVKWWDWPNCDPGWVYNYMMAPGQHADPWDPAAVLKVTQEMKALEK